MDQKPNLKTDTKNPRKQGIQIRIFRWTKDLKIRKNTKSTGTKPSINSWNYMKMKSFCLSMKTISRAQKTPHRMGENLYQQHFEYRLLYRFYQELQKLNTTDIKLPVNKWGNKLNRHFSKTETQMILGSLNCHQRKVNKNYFEILLHSRQNGCDQLISQQTLERMSREYN